MRCGLAGVVLLAMAGCTKPQPAPGPPTIWVPPPGAGPAYGDPPRPRPSAADVEAAKAIHQQAATAYNRGDFAAARGLWEEAYRRDPEAHALLVNIINAAEKEGNLPAACHAYGRAMQAPLPNREKQLLQRKMAGRC